MYHKSLFCSFRYFVLYADVFVYMDSIQFISRKMKFITMNLYMQRCILTREKFDLTMLRSPKIKVFRMKTNQLHFQNTMPIGTSNLFIPIT